MASTSIGHQTVGTVARKHVFVFSSMYSTNKLWLALHMGILRAAQADRPVARTTFLLHFFDPILAAKYFVNCRVIVAI